MAGKLADLMCGEELALALAERQRQLVGPNHTFRLPQRQKLEFYARTNKPATIQDSHTGPVLVVGGRGMDLGRMSAPVEWLLGRPAFSLQELFARYRYLQQAELRGLVGKLERSGLVFPYTPEV